MSATLAIVPTSTTPTTKKRKKKRKKPVVEGGAAPPKKIPMKSDEFYDVRLRARVKVDMSTVTIKIIDGEKYRDGNPRYQAIAINPDTGKKVYKFVSSAVAQKYS